jgi:hypothetical protein
LVFTKRGGDYQIFHSAGSGAVCLHGNVVLRPFSGNGDLNSGNENMHVPDQTFPSHLHLFLSQNRFYISYAIQLSDFLTRSNVFGYNVCFSVCLCSSVAVKSEPISTGLHSWIAHSSRSVLRYATSRYLISSKYRVVLNVSSS